MKWLNPAPPPICGALAILALRLCGALFGGGESIPSWRSLIRWRALMFAALLVPFLVCVAFTAAFPLPLDFGSLFALSSIQTLALFLFSRLSVTSFATSLAVLFLPSPLSHVLLDFLPSGQ